MASYTFNVATGSADLATNWTPNGIPGDADTVSIPGGKCPTSGTVRGTFSISAISGANYGTTRFTGNGTLGGYPSGGVFDGVVTETSFDGGSGMVINGTLTKTRWGWNNGVLNGTLNIADDGQTYFSVSGLTANPGSIVNVNRGTLSNSPNLNATTINVNKTVVGQTSYRGSIENSTIGSGCTLTLDGGRLGYNVTVNTINVTYFGGQAYAACNWPGDHTLAVGDTIGGGTWSGHITVDGGQLYGGTFNGSLSFVRGWIGTGIWNEPITLHDGDGISGGTFLATVTQTGSASIYGGQFLADLILAGNQSVTGITVYGNIHVAGSLGLTCTCVGQVTLDGGWINGGQYVGSIEVLQDSMILNQDWDWYMLDLSGCVIRNHAKLAILKNTIENGFVTDAATQVIQRNRRAQTVIIGADIPVRGYAGDSHGRMPWLGW